MADLVIPEGHGEAVWKWSVTGRSNPISCTIGFSITEPSTLQEVVEDMYGDLVGGGTHLCDAANMRTPFTFLGVEAKARIGGVLVGAASTDNPVEGTAGGAGAMILNSTMLLQKRTILIGRHYRGRMYLPALLVEEDEVDIMGNYTGSEFGVISASVDATTSAMLAATSYKPVILHYGATPPTDISSFVLVSKMATQRRRLR